MTSPSTDSTSSPPVARRSATPTTTARVEIDALEHLSLAMGLADVRPVTDLRATAVTADVHGARLILQAHGLHAPISEPREIRLDLAAGSDTLLGSQPLELDPRSLVAITSAQPATIVARLVDEAGEVITETSRRVTLEPPQFWRSKPLQLGMELLTAHVHPHAQVISQVLQDAAPRLAAATGRGSLDGYQSESPERVDAMVAAIWDAIRARNITYAEPPASWGEQGQLTRSPVEVIGGLGTCLDTTLTLAAALEQAGINSTLWLSDGHIVLAYWRVDGNLDAAATTDTAACLNLMELGSLQPVETTLLCGGDGSAPFAKASEVGREHALRTDIWIVADVRAARRNGVRPLPTRRDDGVIDIQTRPEPVWSPRPTRRADDAPSSPDDAAPRPGRPPAPPRVQEWKNALLDLSLRNRLINYTSRHGLPLAVGDTDLALLEDQLHQGRSLTLRPSDDLPDLAVARGLEHGRDLPAAERHRMLAEQRQVFADVPAVRYLTQLRSTTNKARTILNETGANNLYLACGFLNWQLDGRELRSPLLLIPVTLTTVSRASTYRISLDETGTSTPNYCLLEKLRISLGFELTGLADPDHDADGVDVDATFTAIRRGLLEAGQPFTVDASAELAILQFNKFTLWRDLDEHWESLTRTPLVQHLVASARQDFVDPAAADDTVDLDALGTQVPVPADASQLEAIADAVAGRTFVLEGPPGTGKSQTITNLLAHALRQDKKVLFVAEKRAALDVVRARLDAAGLGPFSLDLHDRDARPNEVRRQIRRALEFEATDSGPELQQAQRQAASRARRLNRYRDAVHTANGAGFTLYSAQQTLLSEPDLQSLPIDPDAVARLTPADGDELRRLFADLPDPVADARPAPLHPWGFVRHRAAGEQLFAAASALDDAVARARELPGPAAVLPVLRTADDAALAARIAALPSFSAESRAEVDDEPGTTRLAQLIDDIEELAATRPSWLNIFTPDVIDLDVDDLLARARAADASGFFGRKKRRRAVVASVAQVLAIPAESVALKEFSAVCAELARDHRRVTELRERLRGLPVHQQLNPWDEEAVAACTDRLGALLGVGTTLRSVQEPVKALRSLYTGKPDADVVATLTALANAWQQLIAAGVTVPDVDVWRGDRPVLDAWTESIATHRRRDETSWTRWQALVDHVEPLRRPGWDHLHSLVLDGALHPDTDIADFEHGCAQASLDERQRAAQWEPDDVGSLDTDIERFGRAGDEVRRLLPEIIPAELAARHSFDAFASSGRIGQLRRQLERQRGGMSVRALLENFGDIITSVMPCVLISPQSVGRYFPAQQQLFDLVVFDEASQIRVADAVGAMGRGQSVVVVGDSKQMPPTSFAQVSVQTDDADDGSDVTDQESILTECVTAAVPRKRLTWHYRSQDESLIAFSNHHYYDDRLASFPAPSVPDADLGVSLVRVDGHFERTDRGRAHRTNRVEAEAIVADIVDRFAASPEEVPSLGVVTFNSQQRELIDNLLRDLDDDRIVAALDEPDGLFVKNLENVQGDERDTIIFSVAFSKDQRGRLPLNFGPLTQTGGERRFNVAITRARRRIVLYASFDPADIGETTSVGLTHLRSYLQLAASAEPIGSSMRLASRDAHRDAIAAALRERGLEVTTDVGLSEFRIDLVVGLPDQPGRVAVMLDGDAWARRRTVADRDDLPASFLTRTMGWSQVLRVWLPRWLTEPEVVAEEIVTAAHAAPPVDAEPRLLEPATKERRPKGAEPEAPVLEPARNERRSKGPDPAEVETQPEEAASATEEAGPDVVSDQPSPPTDLDSHVIPFTPWLPHLVGTSNHLDQAPTNRAARERIRRVLAEAIETEGPIHRARLAKLVGEAFDLQRVASARVEVILGCLPEGLPTTENGDFVWPRGVGHEQWTTVRTSESLDRPVHHVSLVELGAVLRHSGERLGGADRDDLMRDALGLLGGRRLTSGIRERLDQALSQAVSEGRLTHGPHGYLPL